MKRILPLAVTALALFGHQPGFAQTEPPDSVRHLEAMVRKLDMLYRSTSSYAELDMEIVTPHWQRTLSMQAWTKDLSHTFIRITAPAKERGFTTLRIAGEMWNYLPRTNKVIKVPPSMMMGSWMGSDFTNDDLVKETTRLNDFDYRMTDVADADLELRYVDFVPHEDVPVVWSHIVVAVRKSDTIPVWERYYDEDNTLMRVMRYADIRDFDGRTIPATMEMIPQNKEGHRTVIRYRKLDLDVPLENDMFSLRNLRSAD